MGLWKSKNPAPSRKRSILKSPKGKPAKVAFQIESRHPKSHPSTPKRKSSVTKKFVKTDAKTGPSQVCFREDVVEGDGTPIEDTRKSNKSILCRSSLEISNNCEIKSRRQSKTKTEEVHDKSKALHSKRSYLEDKNHSIYAWLEQSEKAMKKFSAASKQSLERDLIPMVEKKPKLRPQPRNSSGEDDGSNKAQISDTNGKETPVITPKKVPSYKYSKEKPERSSTERPKTPRVTNINIRKDSIDMDKVIKQRIFNALDKRELRLATKRHLARKRTVSKIEKSNNDQEDSRRLTRTRAKVVNSSKSRHGGNHEKSRRQFEPEKKIPHRSRRDLKARAAPSSSSESPLKLHRSHSRSRTRRSRKKIKVSRSKKVKKSKIRNRSKPNKNVSEARVSEGGSRTIRFSNNKVPKRSKIIVQPEHKENENNRASAEEEQPMGQSTDDVPESQSVTDLRHVPVLTYTAQIDTIPIIQEKNNTPEERNLNPQGDGLPTAPSTNPQTENNSQAPDQTPQNRGDILPPRIIDFSLVKCTPRKQLRHKCFLPTLPNPNPSPQINTEKSSNHSENVSLHRSKNETDLTDGNLRRSKPCTSLVENLKSVFNKSDRVSPKPCGDSLATNQPQNIESKPFEGRDIEREVKLIDSSSDDSSSHGVQRKGLQSRDKVQSPNKDILENTEKEEKHLEMKPLLPQSCRLAEKPMPGVSKHQKSTDVSEHSLRLSKNKRKLRAPNDIGEDRKSSRQRKSSKEIQATKAKLEKKSLRECIKYNKECADTNQEKRLKKRGKSHRKGKEAARKTSSGKKGRRRSKPGKKGPTSDVKNVVRSGSRERAIKGTGHGLSRVKKSGRRRRLGSKHKYITAKGSDPGEDKPKDKAESKAKDKGEDKGGEDKGKDKGGGNDDDYYDDYSEYSDSSEPGSGLDYSYSSGGGGKYSGSYGSESYGYSDSYESTGTGETGSGSDDGLDGESDDGPDDENSDDSDDSGDYYDSSDESKDECPPDCGAQATETGGICFKLPGRVTHKTTIKVAHFPRSDPICINIPPPPNPCCCGPWCCPNPCCNPCCPPQPGCCPDPCNPCSCGCCPPGTCCCPTGKVLNNCNIYQGPCGPSGQRGPSGPAGRPQRPLPHDTVTVQRGRDLRDFC